MRKVAAIKLASLVIAPGEWIAAEICFLEVLFYRIGVAHEFLFFNEK